MLPEPVRGEGAISPAALWEKVAAFYHETLLRAPEGPGFLARHGLNDSDLVGQFRIGCATGKLGGTLPRHGGIRGALQAMGILDESGSERLLGYVIFPLADSEGLAIGLLGLCKATGEAVHLPGAATGLWNAPVFRTHGEVLVTSDILDALTLQKAGYPNAIAVPEGRLTARDRQTIRASGVQCLACLAVNAGQLREAFAGLPVAVRACPLAEPLNAVLVREGLPRVTALVDAALAEFDAGRLSAGPDSVTEPIPDGFRVRFDRRRYELRGIDKGPRRLRATLRTEHAGRLHVDTLDFYSARARKTLAQDLCRFFEETSEAIEADLIRLIRCCETHVPSASVAGAGEPVDIPDEERSEAEAFGRSPDLMERIVADYGICGLVGEETNKLLCYLAAVSRRTMDPLSVLILSSSGAGKSALQDATVAFCPPEDVVKLTSLSGKALFYKARQSLKHKILALEEGAGAEEATYAIRNLISAGELVIEVTVKDFATGKLTTAVNRVEGPTAVFITTTDPETDPETRSRFFVTSVDESREQTRAILAAQRRRQTLDGQRERAAREAVFRRHRNFQRLLRPIEVVNPFAEQLNYGDDRLQSRRDQAKYLSLIRTVAFLRQMSKQVRQDEGRDYIEVEAADLAVADGLAREILGRNLDDLNRISLDLLMHLERMVAGRIAQQRRDGRDGVPTPGDVLFSRREIREFTGWAHTRVRRYLKQLVDLEFVRAESGRFGVTFRYRLAYDGKATSTVAAGVVTGWSAPGHRVESVQVTDAQADGNNLAEETAGNVYEPNTVS